MSYSCISLFTIRYIQIVSRATLSLNKRSFISSTQTRIPLSSSSSETAVSVWGAFGFSRQRLFSAQKGLDKMTVAIPDWCLCHFNYQSYMQINAFSMDEYTNGKLGHFINDTLNNSHGFYLSTYINMGPELAKDNQGINDKIIGSLDKEVLFQMLGTDHTRDYSTKIIIIANVGTHCCGHMGVWHGGVTSAILDNAFGLVGSFFLRRAATKDLNVQFKLPILTGETVCAVVSFDPQPDSWPNDRFVATANVYNEKGQIVACGKSELVDVYDKWAKNSDL